MPGTKGAPLPPIWWRRRGHDETLGEEESELLRRIGEPPGFFELALGLFGAGVHSMVVLMMEIQTLLFLAGLWAGWNFFEATEPVTRLRWELPAAVLMLMALAIKLSVAPAIHRIMVELKRLELQIARMRD